MRNLVLLAGIICAFVGTGPAAGSDFEGLYRPAGSSDWSCRSEFLGQDGGAIGIVDGYLEGVGNRCQLTDPRKAADNKSIEYLAVCNGEGENYRDIITLTPTAKGVLLSRGGKTTALWERCPATKTATSSEAEPDEKASIPWIVTNPKNGSWYRSSRAGRTQYGTADALGNSVTFLCPDRGGTGKLHVSLNGEAIGGGYVNFTVDGELFNMSALAKGGEINTDCRACSANYTSLWRAIALGNQLTVTDSRGQLAVFSLKGSKRAMGVEACETVGELKSVEKRQRNVGKVGKSILARTRIEKELAANRRYGFGFTNKKVRRGNRAQRFELRHGDCGGNRHWNDCNNDRQRLERKENPKNRIQKIGQQVWYGWSVFVPSDFPNLGKTNTTLGQVKLQNWHQPLWNFILREGRAEIHFSWKKACIAGSLDQFRGKWTDVVVYADYRLNPGAGTSFELYLDGKLSCTGNRPFVDQEMLRRSNNHLYIKYGVYNSYVSRWLNSNKTKNVSTKPFTDVVDRPGRAPKSYAKSPFQYDWGVKLPTLVIHYDEMRYGSTRAQVDVQMIEARGGRPVD